MNRTAFALAWLLVACPSSHLARDGSAESFGDTCAPGAVCDRHGTKRCVRPRAAGERCDQPEQREDLACVGDVCREPLAHFTICGKPRTGPLRR